MKKVSEKFLKILMLISMIFSSLQTPIYVLADTITPDNTYEKGDIRLGSDGEVSESGSVSVVAGSQTLETEGDVQVIKTVSKTDTLGKYKVEFEIKGKDIKSSTQVQKPVYVVVVFDRSGSMQSTKTCTEYNWWGKCLNYTSDEKWEKAVAGAETFASTLLTKIPSAQIALVGFAGFSDYHKDHNREELNDNAISYDDADVVRGFSNSNFDNVDFGSPNGGTNLHAGLYKANELLSDSSISSDAYKYVVVISDGQPTFYYDANGYTKGTGNTTTEKTYNATISMATTVKSKAEVFSIGYMLPSGTVYDGKTAADILTEVATKDEVDSTIKHYVDADPEKVASLFTNIAESISVTKAGTNAVLTDNVGGAFTVSGRTTAGGKYVSSTIPEITEEGIKFSFDIEIDQDSETGWYKTNNGFELTYTDAQGNSKKITCNKDPEVYWVQNTYDYIVNYYKDSIALENLLESDTRQAPKGTIINEENVDKNKYLTEDLISEGYEFKEVTPDSITITNDGSTKVINVIYYVNTHIEEETIDKSTTNSIVTSSQDEINYHIDYSSVVYNVRANETIRVTITDTLPYDIDTTKSNLSNGVYDSTNKTITWVKEYTFDKFTESYKVNIDIDYIVVYKDFANLSIEENNRLVNNVEGKTTIGNITTDGQSDSTETPVEIKGNLVVKYVDKDTREDILTSKTTTDLVGKAYSTSKEDIYGYTYYGVEGNETGVYVEGETLVTYLYSKNPITLTGEEVNKTQENEILNVDSQFKYVLSYNAEIKEYTGNATLTLTDTLPYEVASITYDENACSYSEDTRVLTCTKEFDLGVDNQIVSANFDVLVTYANLTSTEDLNVTNVVNAVLEYNNVREEDSATVTNIIPVGKVIAVYVDEEGKTLAESVITTGLVGTEYETNEKTIYGYTLKEVRGNETGEYTEEDIIVTYVYSKNAGEVTENNVTKTQINTIIGANSQFKYRLSYRGVVENYLGIATLTLTDKLPYDATLIEYDNRCTYDESDRMLTCTDTFELNEDNNLVEATFDVTLTYNNLTSSTDLSVLNTVNSTLTFENTTITDDDSVTDIVNAGKVTAVYVDEEGKTLAESVTTTGLIGTGYETNEKTIYGYTLKEVIGNETGEYTEEDITVTYVYSKNAGTTETNEVEKVGPENVSSVDGVFNYTLSYNGKINDYVGNATLTLKDILPYKLDTERSTYDDRCTYDGNAKILICTETYEITETNKDINETFELSLVFKNVDSNKVTNKVESTLDYGKTPDTDMDETETEVFKGKVIAVYVDEEGKTLAESVITTGLIGTGYETNEKTIYGYTLKEVIGNETGEYTEEDITVTYVYSKNAGTTETNEVEKVGPENVSSVDGVFNYTLTYKGKINDYVGNATLTLKDLLPYELDTEKSTYDDRCTYDENAKTLTCTETYEITGTNKDINAEFKLSLVFKNVDSNKVTNKVESTLDYGKTPDTDMDETETEVFKGKVIAIYQNTDGEKLHEDIVQTGLAGDNYETEELEFLGYTLNKLPENQNGKYEANNTIYVIYIYDKNIGTSKEELEKDGLQFVQDINSPFEYTIKYEVNIFDYVGEAKITLIDYLPYEIDLEKSVIGDTCQYIDGKLVCEYLQDITSEENSKISIEENLVLYYKDITSNIVTNKVEAIVVYGEQEFIDSDEHITEIPYGTLIVKYVTDDGKVLSPTIVDTGLVGSKYTTEQKVFDKYYFKEVIGEVEGLYTEDNTEVTYVYSLIPLPPQTGVENSSMNYLGLLIFAAIVLILKRRYI